MIGIGVHLWGWERSEPHNGIEISRDIYIGISICLWETHTKNRMLKCGVGIT